MRARPTPLTWEPISGIDLTPLISVSFILLLIFMTLTPSLTGESFLPRAASVEILWREKVAVGISQRGDYWLGEGDSWESVTAEQLPSRLARIMAARPARARALSLYADRDAPYRSVLPVLDAARSAGIRRMSLAAERPYQHTARR
jgi:biopolymer transport protein ExbD